MNPCEKILEGMKPVIRAYHTGQWMTHEAQPNTEEYLYREWKKRYENEINLLADRILDIILKKIDCGELNWDLNRKSIN
jgi:hypothetical protein